MNNRLISTVLFILYMYALEKSWENLRKICILPNFSILTKNIHFEKNKDLFSKLSMTLPINCVFVCIYYDMGSQFWLDTGLVTC